MLLCLTANHRNASFDLLEKLSFGAHTAASALVDDGEAVHGAVVLATCNRFEAYLEVPEGMSTDANTARATESTIAAMSAASGVDQQALRESLTVLRGDRVVSHLFAVSSGLESVVVGEDEISGQVRRALERARVAGTTSSGLEQLFQRASTASRAVKTTTAVGTAGRSLVRLALTLASSRVTDWGRARVLLVGTGSYARASLAALREQGATDITVFSPSGRGERFAAGRGIRVSTDLGSALAGSDVVLTCTTTGSPVITPVTFASHRPADDRKLLIDLGLPRNIDHAVADLDGVELLDLETISLHAPLDEVTATADAREVVGRAAEAYVAAAAEQSVAPAVVALRRHVFDLLDAEIDRARRRGDSSERTEAALRHLAGVFLHTPSVRARELARTGESDVAIAAMGVLFGIEADPRDVVAPLGLSRDIESGGSRLVEPSIGGSEAADVLDESGERASSA